MSNSSFISKGNSMEFAICTFTILFFFSFCFLVLLFIIFEIILVPPINRRIKTTCVQFSNMELGTCCR